MPPKTRITRDMILDASLGLIRENGHDALNARAIADALHCSTQPVLYQFGSMDEVREAVYAAADEYHSAYIMPDETDENPMLALGINYVRFGHEEKNLFRFLFQSNKFDGLNVDALMSDESLAGVMDVMAQGIGCGEDEARDLFLTFFCIAHGLASLLANNAIAYDEAQAAHMLENVFFGVAAMRKGEGRA